MSTILLKGANVVNVFLDSLEKKNVLIKDDRIVGVGDYDTADEVIDVTGKYICPGFIDGHIHIESSMLTPRQFVKAAVPCGTSVIVADPHEIANVCGTHGISYMLESSHGMPMRTLIALPSCVPATPLDESGAILNAEELEPFYRRKRVISLGEVMNYPGVVAGDESVISKLKSAKENKRVINGHAPLLKGKDLDAYIAAGITDDHECSNFDEVKTALAGTDEELLKTKFDELQKVAQEIGQVLYQQQGGAQGAQGPQGPQGGFPGADPNAGAQAGPQDDGDVVDAEFKKA